MTYPSSRSKIHTMPESIKKAFIEKTLSCETGPAITQWFNSQSIQKTEKQVYRLTKQIKDRYGRLVLLGMPVKTIVDNLGLIEAKGVEAVNAELVERLDAKSKGLFTFLEDTKEGKL